MYDHIRHHRTATSTAFSLCAYLHWQEVSVPFCLSAALCSGCLREWARILSSRCPFHLVVYSSGHDGHRIHLYSSPAPSKPAAGWSTNCQHTKVGGFDPELKRSTQREHLPDRHATFNIAERDRSWMTVLAGTYGRSRESFPSIQWLLYSRINLLGKQSIEWVVA